MIRMFKVHDLRIWPAVDRIPVPTLYLSLVDSIRKRRTRRPIRDTNATEDT